MITCTLDIFNIVTFSVPNAYHGQEIVYNLCNDHNYKCLNLYSTEANYKGTLPPVQSQASLHAHPCWKGSQILVAHPNIPESENELFQI